jgi:hypothetical protein
MARGSTRTTTARKPLPTIRDGKSHADRVNLGVHSNVNPIAPWASRAGAHGLISLKGPPCGAPSAGNPAPSPREHVVGSVHHHLGEVGSVGCLRRGA